MPLTWQYFLSYFVVLLVLILAMYWFTYDSFARYHRQILLGNYSKELSLIGERNNSELSQLHTMANQITTTPDVSPFRFREDPEKSLRIKKQIGGFKSCSDFISGMFLIFDVDDYVYSATSSSALTDFVDSVALFDDMSPDQLLHALRSVTKLTTMPAQQARGRLFTSRLTVKDVVPIIAPIGYSTGMRIGSILYVVDVDTYEKLFDGVAPGGKDIYIVQNGQALVTREVCGVPREVVLDAARDMAEGQQSREIIIDGRKFMLLADNQHDFDYSYLMLVPDDEMQIALAGSMQAFILIMTLISALCLLLITRFVQSRVKPIRLLHTMILDRKPTGDELLEIRDGVQRLIADNKQLNTQMESVETLRKADFAYRVLTDGFESTDELLSMAERIHLNADARYFAVAILAKPQGADYELSAEKINHLFSDDVGGVSRMMEHDKLVMVAFANDKDRLMQFLQAKFAGLRACCAGMTMAVSAAHSQLSGGQRAYLEAETAFESRFVRGNAEVIRFDQIGANEERAALYSPQALDRLRSALRAGDGQRTHQALTEITKGVREQQTSLFGFRCLYNDILKVITAEAHEDSRGKMFDLFGLSQCLSLDDLDAMLRDACSQIIAGQTTHPSNEAPQELQRAREIIQQRFSEPGLTVSMIAQEVDMTDSKLSVEFKKAFQVTPMECLLQCRMRQARRLLREHDMPVKDVAVECGYFDVSAFNRRFKAYTGMTPQQYRQSEDERDE